MLEIEQLATHNDECSDNGTHSEFMLIQSWLERGVRGSGAQHIGHPIHGRLGLWPGNAVVTRAPGNLQAIEVLQERHGKLS